MKLLAGAVGLGAIALAASAFAATAHRPASTTVHSSALLFNGQIRCSVSIATPAHLGQSLRVRFRLHNLSTDAIEITQLPGTWLVIKSSNGTTFDTRKNRGYGHGGPRKHPTKIAAGGTWVARFVDLQVRWSGPLRITPGCGGQIESTQDEDSTKLPTLHVRVARATAPVSRLAAVAAVVAASGHLLDNCKPSVPGLPVDGVLNAPHGAAPPMRARCSVRVIRERGFDLAQELIVTPPRLKAHVRWAYGRLDWPRARGNWEAIAWQFVVTRDGAVPVVASPTLYGEKTVKHRQAPDWFWTRSGPSGGFREPCVGGIGASGGGSGPDVVWVSACS